MNLIIIFCLLLLKEIIGKSEEYYNCINPENTVLSPSDCISININSLDGYKCCSMKITFEGNEAYNCLTLENKYTISNKTLNEYISKRSFRNLFSTSGGEMEINCGENKIITKNYEKLSNEYNICYHSHINGAENENDCIENDIPVEERSKCCFGEISKIKNNQTINDTRCYIIKDEYFSEKNLHKNYLVDELKLTNLDHIENLNININCKNYDIFHFPDNQDNNKDGKGSKIWIIVIITLVIIFILVLAIIILCKFCCKRSSKR